MARYYEAEALIQFVKQYSPHINGETTLECVERAIRNAPTEDVVPRSEVEKLQKKLNEYKKFVGEIRVTSENHAVIIDTEHTEYIDKRVAEGLKNLAVKRAKQEVAREIFKEIETRLLSYSAPTFNDKNKPIIELNTDIYDSINELKKKYIGEEK